MTLTYAQCLAAERALNEVANEKLPGSIALAVVKTARLLNAETTDFRKAAEKIADLYRPADGGDIPEEKVGEANAQINLLLVQEVSLPMRKLPAELLTDLKLSPATLNSLIDLIEE